jgi:hypothetical protein
VRYFSEVALVEPAAVKLPEEPATPFEELGRPLDGLQCRTCRWRTTSIDQMRMHCKKNHQQAWTGDKSILYDTLQVQSFFRTGGLQKYFIVEYDAVVDAENLGVEATVDCRLAEFKLTQEIIEKELQVLDEAAKTDKTGWYKRTGWMEFFKDRNLSHLAYQLRMPGKHEPKLKLAAELTELLMERCVKGLSTLPHEIRRWLRSAKREAPDTRPLGRLQNPESQARYAGYMVKFVCFYLRIIENERLQNARSSHETHAATVQESSDE